MSCPEEDYLIDLDGCAFDSSDDDLWECAYPGKCLMPSMIHHRSECYTEEDAEAYYGETEDL